MFFNKTDKKVAIVSNDAGGAEYISSMIEYEKYDCVYSLNGPAKSIFRRKLGPIKNHSIYDAIASSDWVLTGTGWSSNFEYDAIKYAKDNNYFVVSYLDHWINYEERFKRNNLELLPDELIVSDKNAYEISTNIFPSITIHNLPNYYLHSQLEKILPITEVNTNQLLYICEPTRNRWGKNLLGEFQALDFFASKIKKMNIPQDTKIILRPHPSDETDKYDSWAKQAKLSNRLSIDKKLKLNQAISNSKWVVGCESYALFLAIRSGREVFCSLPPWAHESRLPFNQIIKLKDL